MIRSNDKQDTRGKSLKIDEYNSVEHPLMLQLHGLGWDTLELKMQQTPQESGRNSFLEVIIEPLLRTHLKKINYFLTEAQIDELIARIDSQEGNSLIENNERILNLLLNGTTVSRNEITGELSPPVRYIDFDNLGNNSFTAISQYKLAIPGTDHHIIPDIVLFVNGLPLVVIEAKSPKLPDALSEALDQLLRYSEQRGYAEEGVRKLFFYNQFVVTTCRNDAEFGTITSHHRKYCYRWSDPYPLSLDDLEHSATTPNQQQRLVAGMLTPRNLLDIIRVFTIFSITDDGHKIKIVGRYQQFRAVKKTTERLLNRATPLERGGIIWHTQGSGKSLTMLFLVREMRLHTALASWKIVFVTDRTKLQDQLFGTSANIGMTIQKAEFVNPRPQRDGHSLKELLSNTNSDMVLAMIQKFQERGDLANLGVFDTLNQSEKILIMTDEAHRSQYSILAANLDKALPNATHIGFTGTPTEKTERRYRDYIDEYTMQQSIDDGCTLKIVYQGFTNNPEIDDKKSMDKEFEDVFSDYNLAERLQILHFGSRDAYLNAEETINAKAKKMIDHYVEQIFSAGFKAQVVANCREAAVKYKQALETALKAKIEQLETDNSQMGINLNQLRQLEIAVVISGSHNDSPAVKQFTNPAYHKRQVERFKKKFGETDSRGIDGNVGILVVTDMLLTGFDAPIEQVLYLDRVIVAHNLLQTIARVNRSGPEDKDCGFIVDFVGVGNHLKKALAASDEKQDQVESGKIQDIIDSFASPQEEESDLKAAHKAIVDFFAKYGLTDYNDIDAFFDLFYDEDIRATFLNLFQDFNRKFAALLPRKEALVFLADWKTFTEIYVLVQQHFRDDRFSMKGIPRKLQAIADKYLKSKGINEKVKPIVITSPDFKNKVVNPRKRTKTKAAAVEHAIREYINVEIDDPTLQETFSQMLAKIFEDFKDNWNKIFEELEKLRAKIRQQESEPTYGLRRKSQMPFFRIFRRELLDNKEQLSDDEVSFMVSLTQEISQCVKREIALTGFWDSVPAQNRLRAELQKIFLSLNFVHLPNMVKKYSQIITYVMETAKTLHNKIINDNE